MNVRSFVAIPHVPKVLFIFSFALFFFLWCLDDVISISISSDSSVISILLLMPSVEFCFGFFLFVCFCFLGPYPQHMEVPRLGSNWSYSCWPRPQPQQHSIRAISATYATAHSNARSPTHWMRPGMEPASSWILVGFVSVAPQWELPIYGVLRFGF